MLTVLAEAVDELEVPADGDTICQVLGLMDRLDAIHPCYGETIRLDLE